MIYRLRLLAQLQHGAALTKAVCAALEAAFSSSSEESDGQLMGVESFSAEFGCFVNDGKEVLLERERGGGGGQKVCVCVCKRERERKTGRETGGRGAEREREKCRESGRSRQRCWVRRCLHIEKEERQIKSETDEEGEGRKDHCKCLFIGLHL